jgi:hypothetical protein
MITLPAFFFLAQAALMPLSTPTPSPSLVAVRPSALGLHGHASPTPVHSPEVRITIVNATSVPAISLSISGTNLPVAYPIFPQGTWTGDAPLKTSSIHYLVRSIDDRLAADHILSFPPVSSQILLITGDLSTSGPPDIPPQLGTPPLAGLKSWTPNLQFHIYPYSTDTKEVCRYRVVNAMPAKMLTLRSNAEPNKPSRQLAILAPGNSFVFLHQPQNIEWEAEIDGQVINVVLEQEGDAKNCLIPFFLRNGHPDFIRVFENP